VDKKTVGESGVQPGLFEFQPEKERLKTTALDEYLYRNPMILFICMRGSYAVSRYRFRV